MSVPVQPQPGFASAAGVQSAADELASLAISGTPSTHPPYDAPTSFPSLAALHVFLQSHPTHFLAGPFEGAVSHHAATAVSDTIVLRIDHIDAPIQVPAEKAPAWLKLKMQEQKDAEQTSASAGVGQSTEESKSDAPPSSSSSAFVTLFPVRASLKSSSHPKQSISCHLDTEHRLHFTSKLPGSLRVDDGGTLGFATVRYDATSGRMVMTGSASLFTLKCSMDPSSLVIPPVEGSPISSQPVQTLALICRYLTASDLLATYQSNKLLSSAASHPLTFQNGCQTGLIDQLGQVTTYARGPSAEFSDPEKLQQAFSGKLFRHFHILRLKTSSKNLAPMLQCLTMERAPTLRSLDLHCASVDSDFRVTEEVRHALRFLTHLHVHGRQEDLVRLLDLVVPSVELLHVTFIGQGPARAYAHILLRPGCSVRQVVYTMQPGVSGGTEASALADLACLEAEPRIEKICWTVAIQLDQVDFKSNLLKDRTWNLRSIDVGVLPISSLPELARFPLVSRLEIAGLIARPPPVHQQGKNSAAAATEVPAIAWPASTSKSLVELAVTQSLPRDHEDALTNQQILDVLAAGRFSRLEKLALHLANDVERRLTPLFESMPSLTELTLGNLHVSAAETIDAFKRVPHLRTLREFTWSFAVDADLAEVFPSLTFLHTGRAKEALPSKVLGALTSIPQLARLKWLRLPVMTPSQIVERSEAIERESQRVRQQRAEADEVERQHRTAIAKGKGTAAMAAVDAVAPTVDDLASWYRGDVTGVAESAESISQRLHEEQRAQTRGRRTEEKSPTVTPQRKEAPAALKPFEMTPIAFAPSPNSPFSLTPAQPAKAASSPTLLIPAASTAVVAFSGFGGLAAFSTPPSTATPPAAASASPFGVVSNPFAPATTAQTTESTTTRANSFTFAAVATPPTASASAFSSTVFSTPPPAAAASAPLFGTSSDPDAASSPSSLFAAGFKAKPASSAKRTPKRS